MLLLLIAQCADRNLKLSSVVMRVRKGIDLQERIVQLCVRQVQLHNPIPLLHQRVDVSDPNVLEHRSDSNLFII